MCAELVCLVGLGADSFAVYISITQLNGIRIDLHQLSFLPGVKVQFLIMMALQVIFLYKILLVFSSEWFLKFSSFVAKSVCKRLQSKNILFLRVRDLE